MRWARSARSLLAAAVVVTERATKGLLRAPLFATGSGINVVGIAVRPEDAGTLERSIVVGHLDPGHDPATDARALAAGAGVGQATVATRTVAGAPCPWFTTPTSVTEPGKSGPSAVAVCRQFGRNIAFAETGVRPGSEATADLWTVAASITRA